jgi:hypothetical protein
MPRKEFESFTRLDASDVNTYLMDQSVMTFAGTAARGSAITTPVEGMVTYLEDSDAFEYWDSAEWTSLAPAAPSGNAIINGAFEINQRGFTSSTATATYTFDRWRQDHGGGTVTSSSQQFTLGAAPVAGYESANFLRTVTAGQSAADHYAVRQQRIESVRSFAGQTVTISFFAKADSGTPKIGVAMTQDFGSGGSPSASLSPPVAAVTISTSWARYSLTYSVPSISGKTIGTNRDDYLGLELWVSAGSTLATRASSIGIQNNTFDIWGVQLEAGPVATPFRRNANSLQGELAACQRYYWRSTSPTAAFNLYALGLAASATNFVVTVYPPVTMRAVPTSLDFSNLAIVDGPTATAVSAAGISNSTVTAIQLQVTPANNLTQFRPYMLMANNTASSFVGFSAEIG